MGGPLGAGLANVRRDVVPLMVAIIAPAVVVLTMSLRPAAFPLHVHRRRRGPTDPARQRALLRGSAGEVTGAGL